jgi:signal transduction histidine kinase
VGPFARVSWIATVGDDLSMGAGMPGALTPELTPDLAQALAGLTVRIPPLRQRREAIATLATDTALAWSSARGTPPRTFADDALLALERHPWPGNQRELEAVVARTLAAEAGTPIHADQLRFHTEGRSSSGPAGFQSEERFEPAPVGPAAEPSRVEVPAREPSDAKRTDALEAPADGTNGADGAGEVRRLLRSLAHEVRNPLVAIRTFASLLPERADDPEFREEFSRLVGADVNRIEGVLDRLGSFAELAPAEPERVDVAAALEGRLEELRSEIETRRLLVLKELDRTHPHARASGPAVELALEFLLQRALAWMPDRADLYLASRYQPDGLRGGPSQRIVLRSYRPGGGGAASSDAAAEALSARETDLALILAEQLVRSQHGTLTLDDTRADETVVVLDLPAAEPPGPASD